MPSSICRNTCCLDPAAFVSSCELVLTTIMWTAVHALSFDWQGQSFTWIADLREKKATLRMGRAATLICLEDRTWLQILRSWPPPDLLSYCCLFRVISSTGLTSKLNGPGRELGFVRLLKSNLLSLNPIWRIFAGLRGGALGSVFALVTPTKSEKGMKIVCQSPVPTIRKLVMLL